MKNYYMRSTLLYVINFRRHLESCWLQQLIGTNMFISACNEKQFFFSVRMFTCGVRDAARIGFVLMDEAIADV